MSFSILYRVASYGFVAAGFFAVAMTRALGPAALASFGAALAAAWFVDTGRLQQALPRWLVPAIALASLPAGYLDFRFLAHSPVLAAVHAVLWVTAAKLLTRSSDRDQACLNLLSFGLLLAAALLTVELSFLIFLFLFLGMGVCALILFEMKRSSARAQRTGAIQPFVVPNSLRDTEFELFGGFPSKLTAVLSLGIATLIAILAIPLFLLLPRVSLGALYAPPRETAMVSGFSETVTLGDIGTIQESDELVMKVRAEGPIPPGQKWRGIALDTFDGVSWSSSRPERIRIATQGGFFKLHETATGNPFLVQTFFLEPIATRIVFGAHRVLAVSTDLGVLERDAADNIYSQIPRAGTIRYSVVTELPQSDPGRMAPSTVAPPGSETGFLQLPKIDPRIAALARSVTAGAKAPYDKARALETYLRTRYAYSLELRGTPHSSDPIAMFLFDVRRGHCEYFASAMAVMLRQIGIPSRLVNGFRTGEYNPVSGHWTVRQYNAHSWVEAWFPPYGWIEFDPTPAGPTHENQGWKHTIAGYRDAIDLWWSDYVIHYEYRRQSRLVRSGSESLRQFLGKAADKGAAVARAFFSPWTVRECLTSASSPAGLAALATAGLALAGFVFAGPLRRLRRILRRVRHRHDARYTVISFYAEALDILQKRGRTRGRSETPIEYANHFRQEAFHEPFADLTAIYNRLRFGSVARPDDGARARALLRAIRENKAG
jgi:protein-glutamine gamma-glutamyltransferase